jgi:chaperone required for assembly of F1-ATPase
MSAWAAKRFWTSTSVVAVEGGYAVHLDARPVKTPSKKLLILSNSAVAQAIAVEWDAQQGLIRPDTMPMTRYANSAVEKVAPQFDAVADHVATYGETDLLCYRATAPQALIDRQNAAWDPWLEWAAQDLNAPLIATAGVMYIAQNPASLTNLRAQIDEMTDFHLSAFHDLVAISGSFVLALAMARGRITAAQGFELSRIDEDWQIEQWGQDDDANALAESKARALQQALIFFELHNE